MSICGEAIRLANKEKITFEDLEEYPCLSFDQGSHNAFYFAEEVLSTYDYKRIIKANDPRDAFKPDGRTKCLYTLFRDCV